MVDALKDGRRDDSRKGWRVGIEITSYGTTRFASRQTPTATGLGNHQWNRPTSEFGPPETALRTGLARFLEKLGWSHAEQVVVVPSGALLDTDDGIWSAGREGWRLDPPDVGELAESTYLMPLVEARARTLQDYPWPSLRKPLAQDTGAAGTKPCWLLLEEGATFAPCLVFQDGKVQPLETTYRYADFISKSDLVTGAYSRLNGESPRWAVPPLDHVCKALLDGTPIPQLDPPSAEAVLHAANAQFTPQTPSPQLFCFFAASSNVELMANLARHFVGRTPAIAGIAIGTSLVPPWRHVLTRYKLRDTFVGTQQELKGMPIWTPQGNDEILRHVLEMPFQKA